jgi:predicted phage baseplate assembly protein
METVEQLKMRGPHRLKSRNRAVTAEDFEWLAMEASNSVARVRAMASPDRVGEVSVVAVPRMSSGGEVDFREKPIPSPELLRRVSRYLDERRLLTTIVRVVRPRYADVSLSLKIVRSSTGPGDRVKRQIDQNLRRFLHPLVGGRDGKGWPFGRSVYKVDLYHLVEEVDGVDFVDSVTLMNLERGEEAEQVRLQEDQLVHLVDIQVTELPREQGV